ncbi:hypothetical protein [Aureimonas sp. AU4]|uniref:hypothetical protein n=1 Tax=Aureimonas sp. AU4 TaxID=1638163 RepID=UPI000781F93F|nr:hypothetical protein [Aureimonas sp. AU4]
MIGTLLVFALGFMAAALIALLFVPFLWQKAQRLARRRFDAEIPASVREMRGEVDAVRARAAFDLRREEMRAADALARATAERSESGRIVLENGTLLARKGELEVELANLGARLEALEQALAGTQAERDDIARDRQALREAFERRGAELEGMHGRHAASQERAALLQERLAQMERRLREFEPARDGESTATERVETPSEPAPTLAERAGADPIPPTAATSFAPLTGGERLRAAIAAGVGARAPASRAENAEIRERVSDLAARIIRRQMDTEGPASPIAAILARDESVAGDAEPSSSLAARVRELGPADGTAPEAATEPPAKDASPSGSPARKDGGGRSRRRSRR